MLHWNSKCASVPPRPRTPGGLRLLLACGWFGFLLGGCAPLETVHQKSAPVAHMTVRTTAYTHTEPGGSHSAVGTRLRFGSDVSSASADWSWLPVGTRFRLVETGRVYVVEDYGSALVGNKTIDLYMPNVPMMQAWGVRMVNVEILEWGSMPMSKILLQGRRGGETARRMLAAMP